LGAVFAMLAAPVLFAAPANAYYSDGVGDGSPGSPYHVLNCGNLSNINTDEEAHYVLDNDIDCTDFDFDMLVGDLSETSNGFTGSFDGQGHEITGLEINKSSENYVGLFARISDDAVVKNLSITANVHGNANVGILAGDIRNTANIERVVTFGIVTCANENCGGITGSQRNASAITKSGSYATVEDAGQSAGGLVGWIADNGTISLSYSSGSVSGTYYVGGLVGAANTGGAVASIVNSYSDGNVTASADYAGGLVGMGFDINVYSSYAAGSVTGNDNVGGLVGALNGNMAETFSAAEVSGTGGAVGPVTGHFGSGTVGNRYFDTVRTGFSSSPDGSSPIDTSSDPDYFLNNSTNPPMSTWTFDSTHWRTNYNYYPSLPPLFDPMMLCEEPQSTDTTIMGTCDIIPLGWGETTWEARWREKDTGNWQNITLNDNHLAQATVAGLTPGTWYHLQFRFTNDFGTGNWGTVEILTTGTAPSTSGSSGSESESGSAATSIVTLASSSFSTALISSEDSGAVITPSDTTIASEPSDESASESSNQPAASDGQTSKRSHAWPVFWIAVFFAAVMAWILKGRAIDP
jgi:hypothetical protein